MMIYAERSSIVLLGTYSADYIFLGEIMATTSRHPANTENSAPIFPLFFLHCNEVIIHTTKATLLLNVNSIKRQSVPFRYYVYSVHIVIIVKQIMYFYCATCRYIHYIPSSLHTIFQFRNRIKRRNIALDLPNCG